MGVLVFLILLTIIGFLIYKYVKADREEKIGEASTDYSAFSVKPIPSPEKRTATARYVAIYEYNSRKNVKVCSCCDGENPVFATHCSICGEQINM